MPSLSGWPELPCARCGSRVSGLDWGALCPACSAERRGRANSLARRISLLATLCLAAYVALKVPPAPMARLYSVIVVVATYLIVRRIVYHVAMEVLSR
jgi:hypothetical protein